ncbi:MAG: hypothetical protein ACK5Q5_07160 [Planctomycetaceae bacterium]
MDCIVEQPLPASKSAMHDAVTMRRQIEDPFFTMAASCGFDDYSMKALFRFLTQRN